ncbi:uncharacterized protein LOC128351992 [Hemicordylus capensis]|uniref:uncharacterized protein LOC128351992 n=1 Tax=Hemicordylus capensis TaxID=884348 RepID=UPI0023046378|nr:uncharacterized protein LOC128351992 [Hemicordylus capensis]XP_053168085.1 uncharacterized protein LOC128351992 [Hemicordylus capensis]
MTFWRKRSMRKPQCQVLPSPLALQRKKLLCQSPYQSLPLLTITLSKKQKSSKDVQQQMRVRRISQQFPRSLRAINLQIVHTRTRLIRSEVRLQRWGKEGDQALMPVIQTASHDDPAGPAACLCPPGSGSSSSASLEVGSIPPSASTSSFLLHPSPPPPPSPPPLEPDLSNKKETLQGLMDLQFHQLNDRQRDLRSCQKCLQNLKALRGQLRRLRSRLARVEATMGILVPPRELDVDEEKEEDKNQTVLHT